MLHQVAEQINKNLQFVLAKENQLTNDEAAN
jgi:hypothetical protein